MTSAEDLCSANHILFKPQISRTTQIENYTTGPATQSHLYINKRSGARVSVITHPHLTRTIPPQKLRHKLIPPTSPPVGKTTLHIA